MSSVNNSSFSMPSMPMQVATTQPVQVKMTQPALSINPGSYYKSHLVSLVEEIRYLFESVLTSIEPCVDKKISEELLKARLDAERVGSFPTLSKVVITILVAGAIFSTGRVISRYVEGQRERAQTTLKTEVLTEFRTWWDKKNQIIAGFALVAVIYTFGKNILLAGVYPKIEREIECCSLSRVHVFPATYRDGFCDFENSSDSDLSNTLTAFINKVLEEDPDPAGLQTALDNNLDESIKAINLIPFIKSSAFLSEIYQQTLYLENWGEKFRELSLAGDKDNEKLLIKFAVIAEQHPNFLVILKKVVEIFYIQDL